MSDRIGMIARAVACLGSQGDIIIRKMSGMYLTRPWGDEDQEDFINAVAEIDTHLDPHELLRAVRSLEQRLGRQRRRRWGPREIDIDILLYGSQVVIDDDLRVPHPRICERGFVLAPLAEVAPDLVHPETGRKVTDHLEDIVRSGETSWQNLGI
jgi:2-amino-4-hydroxy-6-hydroxymethyldihydropteridine diphosphokinase